MSDISHAGKKPYPGFSADGVTQELLRGLPGQVAYRGHGVSSLEINQSRLDVALGTLLQVALLGQGGTRWAWRSLPTSTSLRFFSPMTHGTDPAQAHLIIVDGANISTLLLLDGQVSPHTTAATEAA